MTIEEVIELARQGELQSLSVKDKTDAILGYINLGMLALYDRFPLKTEEYIFERTLLTDIYDLPPDNLRIVSAYGTIIKDNKPMLAELAINEENNPYSINAISWDKIQVSNGITTGAVSLVYVASPRTYTVDDLADTIDLPPQFIEALLHFIGYRAHGAVTGKAQDEYNVHWQRFENKCKELLSQGRYTSDDVAMTERLNSRGFV